MKKTDCQLDELFDKEVSKLKDEVNNLKQEVHHLSKKKAKLAEEVKAKLHI